MKWTSGELSGAIQVAGGELMTVSLTRIGGAAAERPVDGRPPSWRYSPKRGAGRITDRWRVVAGTRRDAAYFEADASGAVWIPYPGSLFLQGGVGVEYEVMIYQVCEYTPPPVPSWTLTLREVTTTAVPLPFATGELEVSEDVTVRVKAAGETIDLRCLAGQPVPLSNWSASGGTVEATTGTLQTIICRGRW